MLASAVEPQDRAVDVRDRAGEEDRVKDANVATLTKYVDDGRLFAVKFSLAINEVGRLRMKIDSIFGSFEEFSGLSDGLQQYSNKLADLVEESCVTGVKFGVLKDTSVTTKKR